MDKNGSYTEKQILNYLQHNVSKSMGVDALTRFCRNAGLIIAPIAETMKGRGARVLYQIIEDNFMLNDEQWIDCYINKDYEVSNLGRIRAKDTKRLIGGKTNKGYLAVNLGQQTNLRAHRVIYFSFHPELIEQADLYVIDHLNGKRDDNRISNLRAISNLQNTQARDQNQKNCQTILAQLLAKYGYEETCNKLNKLLTEG